MSHKYNFWCESRSLFLLVLLCARFYFILYWYDYYSGFSYCASPLAALGKTQSWLRALWKRYLTTLKSFIQKSQVMTKRIKSLRKITLRVELFSIGALPFYDWNPLNKNQMTFCFLRYNHRGPKMPKRSPYNCTERAKESYDWLGINIPYMCLPHESFDVRLNSI